jgi:hypothetical protein
MFNKNPKNLSYLFSVAFHVILLLVFMFVKFSVDTDYSEYVTIGFGSGLSMGSPGPVGVDPKTEKDILKEEKQPVKKEEQKKLSCLKQKTRMRKI